MKYFVLALQKFAEFNGRSIRSEYWYFVLFSTLIQIVLALIGQSFDFEYLDEIFNLLVLLPSIAVGVRRMHDINKSGWHLLIPFYNLYLLVQPGTVGPNEYGEDPLGGNNFGDAETLDAGI